MKKTESHKLNVVKPAYSERINQLKSALNNENKRVPIVTSGTGCEAFG